MWHRGRQHWASTRLKTGVSAFCVLGARDSTTLINSFAEHANVIHRQFWVVAKKRQTLPRICLNISTRDCENYSKSTCLNIASIRGASGVKSQWRMPAGTKNYWVKLRRCELLSSSALSGGALVLTLSMTSQNALAQCAVTVRSEDIGNLIQSRATAQPQLIPQISLKRIPIQKTGRSSSLPNMWPPAR